jgi:hypothetical protein
MRRQDIRVGERYTVRDGGDRATVDVLEVDPSAPQSVRVRVISGRTPWNAIPGAVSGDWWVTPRQVLETVAETKAKADAEEARRHRIGNLWADGEALARRLRALGFNVGVSTGVGESSVDFLLRGTPADLARLVDAAERGWAR